MDSEFKAKFDNLDDLLSGGYISEAEYAAARENLLMDAGFDVSPRPAGLFRGTVAFQPREERGRSGCGCFLMLLLLIVALLGGALALPEGIVKGIPVLGSLMEGQGLRSIRQSVAGFIDDLRGNPVNGGVGQLMTPAPGQSRAVSGDAEAQTRPAPGDGVIVTTEPITDETLPPEPRG